MAKTKSSPLDVFIRSILDLGDYNDDEINNLPSMTDPSQDESIDSLVARLLRGEVMRGNDAVYDIPAETSTEEAFASLQAVNRDGFDISDAQPIMDTAKAALSAVQAVKQSIPVVVPSVVVPVPQVLPKE